jgi:hypothetical protein
MNPKQTIRNAIAGGVAGLTGGGGAGYLLELERRRRNDEANQRYYDSVNIE